MDAREFLGIETVEGAGLWRLSVTPSVSTPGQFLYGGCGLAAGILAMEEASGRPAVWATAQYLAHARTGSVLEIEVIVAASGRHVTQARAVARSGDQEILTVNAALGRYEVETDEAWVSMPQVPPPLECAARGVPPIFANSVLSRMEQRQVGGRTLADFDGTPGPAESSWWMRVPGHMEPSAATLAVLGDMVSGGASQPLGRMVSGRSLDNTLRVVRLVPTEWILCDIHMHAVANGFGHGLAHLWSEDGTLLATASQSVGLRPWTEEAITALMESIRSGAGSEEVGR